MSKNLQEIINGKASKKARKRVAQLAEAVAIARADYGNEGEVIPVCSICTTEGSIPFSQLTADDKLALAEREVATIRTDTNELVSVLEGYGLSDKLTLDAIEEYQAATIATNPILTNLTVESKSKYI